MTPFEEAGYTKDDYFMHKQNGVRIYKLYQDTPGIMPTFINVSSGTVIGFTISNLKKVRVIEINRRPE